MERQRGNDTQQQDGILLGLDYVKSKNTVADKARDKYDECKNNHIDPIHILWYQTFENPARRRGVGSSGNRAC